LLNHELVSRVKLSLVSVLPDIIKDCPRMRKRPKIFLRTLENVAPIKLPIVPFTSVHATDIVSSVV